MICVVLERRHGCRGAPERFGSEANEFLDSRGEAEDSHDPDANLDTSYPLEWIEE